MDFIVKNACKHVVDGLKRCPAHEPFFEPIDPEVVKGYDKVIKYPMDLKTVSTLCSLRKISRKLISVRL